MAVTPRLGLGPGCTGLLVTLRHSYRARCCDAAPGRSGTTGGGCHIVSQAGGRRGTMNWHGIIVVPPAPGRARVTAPPRNNDVGVPDPGPGPGRAASYA